MRSSINRRKFLERIYSEKELALWAERSQCPQNDLLCQEAVWFTQNMLLGPRAAMDQIALAIRRIQKHATEIARA